MTGDQQQMQERIAYLERALEDISAIVASQSDEISLLTRRVRMLLEREAEREAEGTGGVVMSDERPPHY